MRSIYETDYQRLLAALKKARRERRVTQKAIADALRRPQSFVFKYESGERRLDVAEMVHIARLLGLEPSKLVRDMAKDVAPLPSDRKYAFRG
ncbi:MAG: transcriptional regulator, XRE family [Nitrobacter sp.]|uniref:helix-turn-helix domain-containing protein n=1 Tax=Nitrobacter sp. TaxID=29420 RepID=UPI00387E01BA